jgi:hypothetical protein
MSSMRNRIPRLLHWVPLLIPLFLSLWLSSSYLVPTRPMYDSEEYFAMAYNMAKYGVSSKGLDDSSAVRPDMFREPGTSFLMSLPLRGIDLEQHRLSCFLSDDKSCGKLAKRLQRVSAILVSLTVLAVYLAVLHLTGSRGWSFFAALIFSTNTILPSYVRVFASETPAALFFVLHSMALYGAFSGRHRRLAAVVAGASLAALVLCKAVYLYWLLVLWLAAAAFLLMRDKNVARGTLATMLIVLVPATAGVSAWMTRNYFLFGKFAVSERAASVLALRAGYTRMSWEQYFSGYPYFTPYVGPELARRFSGDMAEKTYDDNVPGWEYHADILDSAASKDPPDQQYLRAALRLMLRNWDKQLALMPLTAYRGMFVGGCCSTLSNDVPQYWVQRPWVDKFLWPAQAIFTALLGPFALVLVVVLVRTKNWRILLFCAPVIFHFLIYAAATHFNPRFSVPVYPALLIMSVVLASVALSAIRARF